jgi:hypothetical protein
MPAVFQATSRTGKKRWIPNERSKHRLREQQDRRRRLQNRFVLETKLSRQQSSLCRVNEKNQSDGKKSENNRAMLLENRQVMRVNVLIIISFFVISLVFVITPTNNWDFQILFNGLLDVKLSFTIQNCIIYYWKFALLFNFYWIV